MLRIYLFSLVLLFTFTIHITVHTYPNLDFHLCFHSEILLIFVPFGNPIITIIFQPIPHQNLTLILQTKLYQIYPSVLNQSLLFPLFLHQLVYIKNALNVLIYNKYGIDLNLVIFILQPLALNVLIFWKELYDQQKVPYFSEGNK